MAENEVLAATEQTPAEPKKALKLPAFGKGAKGPNAPKPKSPRAYLPVLVEFSFTFSVVFLILVFLTLTVVSVLSRTPLLEYVLRTSVSMVVLGGLLVLFSRQVSTGMMSIGLADWEAAQKRKKEDVEKEESEAESQKEKKKARARELEVATSLEKTVAKTNLQEAEKAASARHAAEDENPDWAGRPGLFD